MNYLIQSSHAIVVVVIYNATQVHVQQPLQNVVRPAAQMRGLFLISTVSANAFAFDAKFNNQFLQVCQLVRLRHKAFHARFGGPFYSFVRYIGTDG